MLTTPATESKLNALADSVNRLLEWLDEDQVTILEHPLMHGQIIVCCDRTQQWQTFPPCYPLDRALKEMGVGL